MLGEVFVDRNVEGLLEETHRIVRVKADMLGRLIDEKRILVVLRDVGGELLHFTKSSFTKQRLRSASFPFAVCCGKGVC